MGNGKGPRIQDPRDTCPKCSTALDHDARMMYRARHNAEAIFETTQKLLDGTTPKTRKVSVNVATLREVKSMAASASLSLEHGVEVNGGEVCTED